MSEALPDAGAKSPRPIVAPSGVPRLLSLDAILLLAMVLARSRIDTFTNVIVPRPMDEVLRLPGARWILSDQAVKLMNDFLADPLSLLVLSAVFTLTFAYVVLDFFGRARYRDATPGWLHGAKLGLVGAVVFVSVGLNTLMVLGLRVATEPHRYAHDGGVLMTEQAATWVSEGKNPYEQDFHGTAMEKAFPNGPGLIHYPYLPMAFLPTVPIQALFRQTAGWFDQRLIYLTLYAVTLVAVGLLVRERAQRLVALILVGLNPILANDTIYGLNDVFLLAWVALAALFAVRGRPFWSALFMGVALATKLTVWPVVPFYLLSLYGEAGSHVKRLQRVPWLASPGRWLVATVAVLLLPLLLTALPYAIADFGALYDDVWAYNVGASALDPVPVKGWGLSNLVLLWGWVPSTTAYFPFWLPQAIAGLPLLAGLLWAQRRANNLSNALLAGGVFLLVFFLLSRTMNANYLGFTLSMMVIGYFAAGVRKTSSSSVAV